MNSEIKNTALLNAKGILKSLWQQLNDTPKQNVIDIENLKALIREMDKKYCEKRKKRKTHTDKTYYYCKWE